MLTAAVGKQQLDVITPIEMSFDYDEAITLGIDTERILLFDPESEKNIQQL